MKLYRIVDFAAALAAFAYGSWLVATSWPEPSWLAWTALALGVLGMPVAFLDPKARIERFLARRLVKRA